MDENPPLATVRAQLPQELVNLPVTATLRAGGRIAAAGRIDPPGRREADIPLRPARGVRALPDGAMELHLVAHADQWMGAYPGFGDHYAVLEVESASTIPVPASTPWRERTLSHRDHLLTLHYHRYDGDYDNAGIWTWDVYHRRAPEDPELLPVGKDAFGLVFQLDTAAYGTTETPRHIGLAPRLGADWARRDGDDRTWVPEFGNEIYMVSGRNKIYSTPPPVEPHVVNAFLDAPTFLHLEMSHPVKSEEIVGGRATLRDNLEAEIPVREVRPLFVDGDGLSSILEIETDTPMDPANQTYHVAFEGFGREVHAVPRDLLDDPDVFYSDSELGADCNGHRTVFRVFAPLSRAAWVNMYAEAQSDTGRLSLPMKRSGHGVWELEVEGDLEGRFYTYSFDGNEQSREIEVADIHATNTVDSGRRARIAPTGKNTVATRGPALRKPTDAVVWEVHVRDLSMASNSGIRHKGLYLGFTESGTTVPDHPDIRTGIDHIVEMGVTHVQILPVQDFQNEESGRLFNWGYLTNHFNSPEGVYASNIHDDSRVRELKALIEALHERGIGVIMDVVYNHTGTSAPFNLHVPRYYYRLNGDGTYANGSGCGNEFRTESPMGRRFVVDSLAYWVREYGVDGFRFDLMSLMDRETMVAAEKTLRKIRPDILLYGEPWQAAHSPLQSPTNKHGIRDTGISAFNDDFRNTLKGPPDGDAGGFIQHGGGRDAVEAAMAGSTRIWTQSPAQSVNYLACHDNLVLYDKLKLSRPDAGEEEIAAMTRLGYFLLLTSQGVPFLHAGDEFLRTKFGDHNSYESPDSVNQIDWELKAKNLALCHYVRNLVALRKAHPLFRLATASETERRVSFHHAPSGDSIVCQIDGRGLDDEPWQRACLLVNASDTHPHRFTPPEGKWRMVFDSTGQNPDSQTAHAVKVPPKCGVILAVAGGVEEGDGQATPKNSVHPGSSCPGCPGGTF